MVFLKEFFEKVVFEKNQQTTKKAYKITQLANSKAVYIYALNNHDQYGVLTLKAPPIISVDDNLNFSAFSKITNKA